MMMRGFLRLKKAKINDSGGGEDVMFWAIHFSPNCSFLCVGEGIGMGGEQGIKQIPSKHKGKFSLSQVLVG